MRRGRGAWQHPALALAVVGAVLIVLPFSYRQALMVSMVGMVVCLSLVVITGFVGQVSLAQVTLAGVAGFAVWSTAKAGIGFRGDRWSARPRRW